jgi:5-methylcytosine-specific restriction endonuclease McrA
MAAIPSAVRQHVAAEARQRCGYCQTQELVIGMPLEIEHIIPEALGGSSEVANLWLACPRCNRYKGVQTHAIDAQTGQWVPLFNPRVESWIEHFIWEQHGCIIGGLTAVGRATISALQMNNSYIVRARHLWVLTGVHPPEE